MQALPVALEAHDYQPGQHEDLRHQAGLDVLPRCKGQAAGTCFVPEYGTYRVRTGSDGLPQAEENKQQHDQSGPHGERQKGKQYDGYNMNNDQPGTQGA